MQVIWISLLGVMGVLCRYGADTWFASSNENFPVTTFVINILGSMLAGLIYALSAGKEFSELQLALLVGFCGGFTTFSAYSLQTLVLFERGKIAPAIAYVLLSPALGLLAACLPVLVLRKLH